MDSGWIKLHRSMLKWEWYDDINTKVVFLHLLLTVSITDKKWHGIAIKRGSRVISYQNLAAETNLSVQKVRTVISRLESTGEITRTKHNKFTVISLKNYNLYQGGNTQDSDNITDNQQDTNIEPTNSQQQYKKVKECKESIRSVCVPSGTPAHTPSAEEIISIAEQNGFCWGTEEAEKFLAYNIDRRRKGGWEYAVKRWEENRKGFRSRKRNESELTPEEQEYMDECLALVNRFREDYRTEGQYD